MHFVKAKGILSSKNGMNLYRGCTHGCIYCDSRSTIYNMNHIFEDIEVKENSIELLEDVLRRKRNKCMIGMGAMTNPYIAEELNLNYTRRAIEVINREGFGLTLITKSDRVLKDIDLFKQINDKSKCVIQMTLTTYDEALCKKIEPNVSTTFERFKALKLLSEIGIPTVVWLTPILPFINDTDENLMGILKLCKEANVKAIICFGMGVTLREGNREFFYKKLDLNFKGLKEKYIKTYGNSYILNSKNNEILMKKFHGFCEENGIMHENQEIFKYLNEYNNKEVQLSFF